VRASERGNPTVADDSDESEDEGEVFEEEEGTPLLNEDYFPIGVSGTGLTFVSLGNFYSVDYSSGEGKVAKTKQDYLIYKHQGTPLEFLYYKPLKLTKIFPHSGSFGGGTKVWVHGANFMSDRAHGCTPKCRFGTSVVEAELVNSVLMICVSPPHYMSEGQVELDVTMNGVDFSSNKLLFDYYSPPVVTSIYPKAGQSQNGAMLYLKGYNFVNLTNEGDSGNDDEFVCKFTSSDLSVEKIVSAYFKNETTVLCSLPGGWKPGDVSVELSINGLEYSGSASTTFRAFNYEFAAPLSGPSSGDSNKTIYMIRILSK
jgi:hypothetical protein